MSGHCPCISPRPAATSFLSPHSLTHSLGGASTLSFCLRGVGSRYDQTSWSCTAYGGLLPTACRCTAPSTAVRDLDMSVVRSCRHRCPAPCMPLLPLPVSRSAHSSLSAVGPVGVLCPLCRVCSRCPLRLLPTAPLASSMREPTRCLLACQSPPLCSAAHGTAQRLSE